jgi:hypothetical protein
MHLTLGILRPFQAVFYALAFFWLDGFAVPAPAQVTQTVNANREAAKLFAGTPTNRLQEKRTPCLLEFRRGQRYLQHRTLDKCC